MRFIIFILRTALALVFLAYGINFFYHLTFVPAIPTDTKKELPLIQLLIKTRFFFETLYGIQIACGFFLLIHRFTPLFLLVALPITVNVFLFDYFLDPNGQNTLLIYGSILLVNLLLLIYYRKAYRPLFYSRAQFVDRELEVTYEEERPEPPEIRL